MFTIIYIFIIYLLITNKIYFHFIKTLLFILDIVIIVIINVSY